MACSEGRKRRRRDITRVVPPDIKHDQEDALPVKGSQLISTVYGTTCIFGTTGSGKTVLLHHVLKNTLDRRTRVFIIASTHDTDPVYRSIKEMLAGKGCSVVCFDSLIDERKVNVMEAITKVMTAECADDASSHLRCQRSPTSRGSAKTKAKPCVLFGDETAQVGDTPKKRRRYRTRVPRFVIVCDDLDKQQVRSESLYNVAKKIRHFNAHLYILSQHPIDCKPSLLSNTHQVLIGRTYQREYLERVFRLLQVAMTFEAFWELYQSVISTRHHFLHLDRDKCTWRDTFGTAHSLVDPE